MNKELKHIKKTFTKQYAENYCGLACLVSIAKFYGCSTTQEKLRAHSGTTKQGTTLLGLYQVANRIGFEAKGYEAGIKELIALKEPAILHILKEEKMEHYVICYGHRNGRFLIGDPGWGLTEYQEDELEAVWKSKAMLKLHPGKGFIRKSEETKLKLKWIKSLIAEDIAVLSFGAVLGILLAVSSLATAFFSQKLIDVILPGKDVKMLIIGLSILLVFLFASGLLSYVRGVVLLKQGRDFNKRIVSFFFNKLVFLPRSFFNGATSGDLITRLSDTSRIRQTIIKFTNGVLIDVLKVIGSLSYIFILSSSIGLLSLVSIPVFGYLAWIYNQKIINSQRMVMQSHSLMQSKYIDTIQGISEIKIANKEVHFSTIIKTIYSILQKHIFNLGLLGAKIGLLTQICYTLIFILIIGWASYLVFVGSLMLGQMMAIMTLAGGMISSVISIAMSNISFQEARVAFDRMYEFVSDEPEYNYNELAESDSEYSNKVETIFVKDLSFRFPGKRLLLKEINFVINRGQIVTLFGEIGCGKSTLLSVLQRFYSFESGNIMVNGEDWNRIDHLRWRELVASVSQNIKLFNGTIFENICFENVKEVAGDVALFCEKYGFHKFIMEFQQGYATVINENSTNLSGGQQQLIALARALYQKPKVLLLDEATAAMDRRTEHFVLDLLHRLKKDMTIVFVTHRVQVARHTDYVYTIENGMISHHGKHNELIQFDNIYSQAFEEIVITKTL
ncbi:MAG: peptidase domain-containing ABC transporter [Draconibacterium sp.]